jgi:hypothetical protein
MSYEPTHRSRQDGSEAVLVRYERGDRIVLRNENGDEWTDAEWEWEKL